MLTLRGEKRARRGPALQDLGIIEDGSILVQAGKVYQAGPTRRIENLSIARDAVEINAAGRVVMPGFVDSHTHFAFPAGDRSCIDAAARLVRGSSMRLVQAKCRVCLDAMARHGTTTVEVDMGCGLDESSEWKLFRALRALDDDPLQIVRTLRLLLSDAECEGADPALREIAPRIRRHGTARFAAIEWHAAHAETPDFTRLMHHLRQLSFDPKVHAGSPAGSGAMAAVLECGAASVDHLENMHAADAPALGRSETIATLAPASEWNDGPATISARAWIDSGVAIALASNFSPGQAGTLSMQMVVALAVSRMGLSINEAICAATINGAHALRCADRTGSLEPGKAADLLLLNVSDYRELGRNIGVNLVHSTMKGGKFIYREGKVLSEKSRPS